jgi:ArsR family transcriptional regulator
MLQHGQRDGLARQLRALGHPARIAILEALGASDQCQCGDLVREMPLAQSTVSEHLRVLKEAGLVRDRASGNRTCYCLDRTALSELSREIDRLLAAFGNDKDANAQAAVR